MRGYVRLPVRPSRFALWVRYVLQYCPITFKLHMSVVDGDRMNPIELGHGSKVKVKFGTLSMKPCGHST